MDILPDISDSVEGDFALEKMNYTQFRNTFMVRRAGQAANKIDRWSEIKLPNNSILHTVNGFETLSVLTPPTPLTDLPPVHNEKLPVWLMIHANAAGEDSVPFPSTEAYIYRQTKVAPLITHFYQKHRTWHPIRSARTINGLSSALVWLDYSPLNHLVVNGTNHNYRKFDVVFRTILDTIVGLGADKHHFIHLPQSDKVYGKALVQRAFGALTNATLNVFHDDMSIFPIIHLLAFIFGHHREMSVTPFKSDLRIFPKGSDALDALKTISYFERLDPAMFAHINFIIQRGEKAVVYNLQDIADFSKDGSFYLKFYRHVMRIRADVALVGDDISTDSDQFDKIIDAHAPVDHTAENPEGIDDTDRQIPSEPAVGPIVQEPDETPVVSTKRPTGAPVAPRHLPEEPDEVAHIPDAKTYEDKLRSAVAQKVSSGTSETPIDLNKHEAKVDRHFSVQLNGSTIGELVSGPPPAKIAPRDMSFINSPEKSYHQSTLVDMDRTYQNHVYYRDMGKVLSSLAKHGLYLTNIEETKNHTDLERIDTYKATYTDDAGRQHTVRYSIPHIDDNGLMMLGGTEYRMTRQIANVPICKITKSRVALSSHYNKLRVERVVAKRNSFEQDILDLVLGLRAENLLSASIGTAPLPTRSVPYDYSAIGQQFTEITVGSYHFVFGGDHAPYTGLNESAVKSIETYSARYGVYCGVKDDCYLFWDNGNQIHAVSTDGKPVASWASFNHLLVGVIGDAAIPPKTTLEWTEANILSRKIPLVHILGYRLGLKKLFEIIKLKYVFYPKGEKPKVELMDVVIKFADGVLVFNRYPIAQYLIAAGLGWCDLSDINFIEMDVPDTYVHVFQKKKISIGMLRGINDMFDFFVDPITESILEQMKMPVTFTGLLLKANLMVSDYKGVVPSSLALHRFRLYERINGIIYKEIYRALAKHRGNPNQKASFSLNPEAVFQQYVQDATTTTNDVINPIHEIKQLTNFTYTGGGGRTARGFVQSDLVYPPDALGVISDAVPDSSKVGISAYLSASPRIDNIHGMPVPYKEGDELDPAQILSIGPMCMPASTTDDGKRNGYTSIQLSHYVPNIDYGETLAVRTGYDAVLPHLVGNTFATSAPDDGVVESIDEKRKVVTVRYADKDVVTTRKIKVPYFDASVNELRQKGARLGFLVPDTEVGGYPIGGIFSVTSSTNVKVVDRLRCDSMSAIPASPSNERQRLLLNDFAKGKYKALYFIVTEPMGTKVPGDVVKYDYSDMHTSISGAHLLQRRAVNFQVGERVKRGDILIYNVGFFVPDPMSKQVTFKHGVTATIALVDRGSNHEDAGEITRDFSKKLGMNPCHLRSVVTSYDKAVVKTVDVGDMVASTDSLCILTDQHLVESEDDNIDLIEKLSRQTPLADYAGKIVDVRMLYSCDKDLLSESLRKVLRAYEKRSVDRAKSLGLPAPTKPGWVAVGTKYKGIDFDEGTVVLEYMIEQTIGMEAGDKLVISNAAKSIISHVSEKPHYTKSGIPVDMIFSTTSVANRIVASPISVGIVERCMEKLKANAIAIYRNKK